MSTQATVTPAGRWSWYIEVSTSPGEGWTQRAVRSGHVIGSRTRADRVALRWVRREKAWQQRLHTDTHTVIDQ